MFCQQPPWGQLTAVNVNTGEFAWRVPLGITESLPPEKQKTGRPGNGGTIATAGGLVFVGATDDSRFRAFDAKTGKELWTYKLPGAAQATPMTYQGRDGKQYVVITATGGGFFGNPVTGDSVIAFALLRDRQVLLHHLVTVPIRAESQLPRAAVVQRAGPGGRRSARRGDRSRSGRAPWRRRQPTRSRLASISAGVTVSPGRFTASRPSSAAAGTRAA